MDWQLLCLEVVDMFPRTRAVVTALFVTCMMPSLAHANTITLNDPGIVGAVEGVLTASNPDNVEILAERLLAMAINQVILAPAIPGINCDGGNVDQTPCEYKTGDNEYASANLTFVGKDDTGSNNITSLLQGDVYIMAKYDGPNAGYILFYLPDWNADPANTDNVLPQHPWSIFGTQDGQFAITHYNAYTVTNVPDGGLTLALLGGALLGLGALRRRFNA